MHWIPKLAKNMIVGKNKKMAKCFLRTLTALSGLEYNSQHLHDSSQPSLTLVPEDLTLSSGTHGHQTGTRTDMHAGKHPYT